MVQLIAESQVLSTKEFCVTCNSSMIFRNGIESIFLATSAIVNVNRSPLHVHRQLAKFPFDQ